MSTVSGILGWVGSQWGEQDEYLVCEPCDRRFDLTPLSPHTCPACDGELAVTVPNSEYVVLRWLVWKSKQEWIPQRLYVLPTNDEQAYRYVRWRGREWLKRPWRDALTAELSGPKFPGID